MNRNGFSQNENAGKAQRAVDFLSSSCLAFYALLRSRISPILPYTYRSTKPMADVPKLEKKRELLAPKSVGPLGRIVLLGGASLAVLGMTPSGSALPTF